jgi:FlaA1/EpsC-like NDP-sugar epimerase
VLSLSRTTKRLIAGSIDVGIAILSVLLAFYLRLGEWRVLEKGPLIASIVSVVLLVPILTRCGMYRVIFRYNGLWSLGAASRAILIYGLAYAAIFLTFGISGVPRTLGLIQPILVFIFLIFSRATAHQLLARGPSRIRGTDHSRVMIYGAGSAGRQLASAIQQTRNLTVAGFLDDDLSIVGHMMNGLPIYSGATVTDVIATKQIDEIVLAIPSATRFRRAQILAQLRLSEVKVRTLPAIDDIARGRISVGDLRELDVEDLLGRAARAGDNALLSRNVTGKVVMVTGAGGSIGSELVRQIWALQPHLLLLVDNGEYALYRIAQEVSARKGATLCIPLLASVCDADRMHSILAAWRPETIFHAAAYKHVPLVEHNVVEGIRNNVVGTWVCARLAAEFGVANFTLVSTDKAVRPTNVMGASKRLAEMVLQACNAAEGTTRFSMVRFGNVLESSGSVVPLFRSQISTGGPVTITHPDITRYFMTIPEAAQLVLQAGAMADGGEVFLLDMGEPIRILDLAHNMIKLSGLHVRDADHPDGDIEIEVVGLRPGEKLFEELLIAADAEATSHSRIMKANEAFLPWSSLRPEIERLIAAINELDAAAAREILQALVVDFQPMSDLVDHVATARPSSPAPLVARSIPAMSYIGSSKA